MPDMNSLPVRIEAGSVITLIDLAGAPTSYVLKVLEAGTLVQREAMFEPLAYMDRGVQQTPLIGDAGLSEVEFDAKYTGSHNANDLRKVLSGAGASGLVRLFDVQIDVPDYKGASTGDRITFNDCWVQPPIEIQSGDRFDTCRAKFVSKDTSPVTATY